MRAFGISVLAFQTFSVLGLMGLVFGFRAVGKMI